MPGIVIPSDRTTKQPVRGYCQNPDCLEASNARRFEFTVEHDRFACPKCGNDEKPGVGILVLIHLLVRSPKGPVIGQHGRYRLACDSRRAYLATLTNLEAATDDPAIANCPGCLAEAKRLGIARAQGVSLDQTAAAPAPTIHGSAASPGGCCS